MTPPITYTMQVDSARDGTFSQDVDDITRFVKGQITTTEGMANAYDEVSQPATMTFTCTNAGGEFNRDPVGAELLVNNTFSAWSGGLATGWGYTSGASGTDFEISEVGEGQLHGQGGNGAVNFYSNNNNGSFFMLYQQVLTPGNLYRLRFTISYSRDSQYSSVKGGSGTEYGPITFMNGNFALILYIAVVPQQYEVTFKAVNSFFYFGGTAGFNTDVTVDSVSLVEIKPFYRINIGTLCRLRATYNGTTTTLFAGRITAMKPTFGQNNEPLMQFTISDAMLELLDAEYQPPLLTAPTVDTVLTRMFDDAVIRWPYSRNYWLLGVPGSSELEYTTTLYSHSLADFDTGITEFAYVGDLADRGQGISAQGYIRDLVQAEAGGRFFWDARNQTFVFQNRHYDPLNETIAATFTENDFDSTDPRYGEDIKNSVTINYSHREVGAAGSVIWTYPSLPFLLKSGVTRKFNARYFDATDNTLKIGAMDFQPTAGGTDFVANTASNGNGTDLTSFVTMFANTNATAATVHITNGSSQDVYITTLQLRGTPLVQKDESTDALDGPSIREYELHPAPPQEMRLLDDPDLAFQLANWLVGRFKTPTQRLNNIVFNSLRNPAMMDATINRVIGDKITITVSDEYHDADYIIVGVNRMISVGGDTPAQITWTLKPAIRETFWVLEVAGKSELGSTTILAI